MQPVHSRKVKIGLIQVSSNYNWSVEQCQKEMLELAERCLQDGADLVFMPEENQYKGCSEVPRRELIQKYAPPYRELCRELARKYNVYVVPWDYEQDEDGSIFNTSYILDREGNEIGKHRKVLITRSDEEKQICPGTKFQVFELDFGKVGIMICFDNYFSEAARCLALQGAELILYPLYGDTLKDQWEIRTKCRAIDNSVYVASCHIHSVPIQDNVCYTGMFSPTGETVAALTQEGSHQVVEVELGTQVLARTLGPGSEKVQDIKQYLLYTRQSGLAAFKPLLEPTKVLDWEDIEWIDRRN